MPSTLIWRRGIHSILIGWNRLMTDCRDIFVNFSENLLCISIMYIQYINIVLFKKNNKAQSVFCTYCIKFYVYHIIWIKSMWL